MRLRHSWLFQGLLRIAHCICSRARCRNLTPSNATASSPMPLLPPGPYPATNLDCMDALSGLEGMHFVYICRKRGSAEPHAAAAAGAAAAAQEREAAGAAESRRQSHDARGSPAPSDAPVEDGRRTRGMDEEEEVEEAGGGGKDEGASSKTPPPEAPAAAAATPRGDAGQA